MKTVESVAQFVEEMTDVRCIGSMLPPLIWFRGHAVASWQLRPGILRDAVSESVRRHTVNPDQSPEIEMLGLETAEQMMNEHFRRSAASLLPPTADSVEVYFLAQHHGLPTRLLDWTDNPLAALFFAVAERDEEDGELVSIVVDWRLSFGEHRDPLRAQLPFPPLSQRSPLIVETIRYVFEEGARPDAALIVPLRPDLRASRMWQQSSCFTLHMPGCSDIHELPSNSERYRIPSGQKAQLRAELDSIGVNWASLFHDLDHVTRHLKATYDF